MGARGRGRGRVRVSGQGWAWGWAQGSGKTRTCRAAIAAPCCSETPAESPSLSPPPRRLRARSPASRTWLGLGLEKG